MEIIKIVELSLYLLIAASAFIYRTVLSGRKNGCFYFKNSTPPPRMLAREINNLHFIETPAWYAQTIGVFALFFVFIRASSNQVMAVWPIVIQVGITALYTIGTIMAASYHFQRGITAGTRGDHELDKVLKSEVAIVIFGKKIQFWKGRLFSNERRKLAQWLGIIEIVAAIALAMWYNFIR